MEDVARFGQRVSRDRSPRTLDPNAAHQAGTLERAERCGQRRGAYPGEAPLDRSEPDHSVLSQEGHDADSPLLPHDVDQPYRRTRADEIALAALRHFDRT